MTTLAPAVRRTRVRPALPLLLTATGVLYVWGLGASGWANAYYSAAAQAGAASWKALLFGATDAAGGITIDKTPASVWVMGLSARLFGVNTWSILVPQALMGVATVWLLYAAVRRVAGEWAALVAGVVLALTPVAVLMFRFNNPDALLVLLLTAGAYATVRAIEDGRTRWLVLAGACVGFGFLTKMLQAFLVLPGFGIAYVVGAKRRRILGLATALGSMVVAGGWWVLLVSLWPAADRPYIGGSQDNSVLELTFGYNGFGRLTGDEVGSVGGGAGGTWGSTGWGRLLSGEMAGGIAWLLPAAVVLLGGGLWATWRRDPAFHSLVLWGGWFVVTGAVFSYMNGIIHPYYTVALAPALAAVVGIGGVVLWRRGFVGCAVVSGAVALTALETYLLLDSVVLLVIGLVAAGLVLLVERNLAVVGLAVVVALAGPGVYSFETAAAAHTGAIPSAGPANQAFGGPGGGGGPTGARGGGMGGLLDAPSVGADLANLLADSGDHTWAAATVGSNNAAGYQLASGRPVLAVGGFNGTDPYPTLAEFQEMVRSGQIRYFVGDGGMSGTATGGSDAGAQIAEWVAASFTSSTVSGVTVYDLTS
ncbi:glycosyltransferase family 39 protein [Actinophytocola oryzae]|uniref:4-amino-4-deoxy-L-arabinose transferase-like glycosyltransferase n=1 Tax=Actinophytocola oryzae TaxID=502181 RepID=A0A4V3FTR2_9PSEU|nr:glycosyltransferase family 39 protein [Actinophytocola oryzae]TDV52311.1 4-amino-4-deoxy-L-arabinose transferase-like glycosyltransferase [Actinophytocola oryzae]